MSDEKDPPIEPQDYISGVTVVDIGDLRVARGLSRRPHSACRHSRVVYDKAERRIWCRDCERDVEAFDAYTTLIEQYNRAYDSFVDREKKLQEAEKFQVRSIAAKKIDEAWRSRNMVPACPHCSHGLFPENFKNGMSMMSRDYAQARIDAKQKR